MSRKHGGEKYVKSFDGYTHLLTMLYAVIQRFDSLREIESSMTAEVRKLHHVGIDTVPKPRKSLQKAHKSKIGVCLIQIGSQISAYQGVGLTTLRFSGQ